MDLDDFALVLDVHLMGSVNLTKAAWAHMRDKGYGRVIFTTSSSGLYGNFGQSNYGAAKMALVGLMQTLALEGQKFDIRVKLPGAERRHADDRGPLLGGRPEGAVDRSGQRLGVVALASANAPTKTILLAGSGRVRTGAYHHDAGRLCGRPSGLRQPDRKPVGSYRQPAQRKCARGRIRPIHSRSRTTGMRP